MTSLQTFGFSSPHACKSKSTNVVVQSELWIFPAANVYRLALNLPCLPFHVTLGSLFQCATCQFAALLPTWPWQELLVVPTPFHSWLFLLLVAYPPRLSHRSHCQHKSCRMQRKTTDNKCCDWRFKCRRKNSSC